MSGYAVGHVLRNSRFNGTALLVLIVIAEATHQDGRGAWPSVASIADLARTTERNVRRVLRQLEKSGELVTDHGKGPYGTSMYAIPMAQLRLAEGTDNLSGGRVRRRRRTTKAVGDDKATSANPSSIRNQPSSRARARGAAGSNEPRGKVASLVRDLAKAMRMPA